MSLRYLGSGEFAFRTPWSKGRRIIVEVSDIAGCDGCGGSGEGSNEYVRCRTCRGSGETVCYPYATEVTCACGEVIEMDDIPGVPDGVCPCGADIGSAIEQAIAAVEATHTEGDE